MAQLEKGELTLQYEDVNMHTLIYNAVELIAIQVENKNGRIQSELHAENPVLKGDAFHLSNVIFNLLDNANKYSPEKPEIIIETLNLPRGFVVKVSDHGIGMTKETQKKIFDKFYRVSK
jgi:two-component system phosphate regulon sensor histidine kinase PhoR